MQEIYRQATHGVIWLGEVPSEEEAGFTVEDVGVAFEMLEFFGAEAYQEDDLSPNTSASSERLSPVLLTLMGSPHAPSQSVKWWSCIWTVQEAKLPPSSTLQWGAQRVSFDALKRIALRMTQSGAFCWAFDQVFALGWLLNQFCTPLAGPRGHGAEG
jgi:hypothetical protein